MSHWTAWDWIAYGCLFVLATAIVLIRLLVTPAHSAVAAGLFRDRLALTELAKASARQNRDDARRQRADGADPGVKRKLDQIAAATAAQNTFGAVAAEYLANMAANGSIEKTIGKHRWMMPTAAEYLERCSDKMRLLV